MNRRGFLGILTGAVAAPIVVRSGLIMPVKAIIRPEPSLTVEEFVRRYLEPSMKLMAEQVERDLLMYGSSFHRGAYTQIGDIRYERIDPSDMVLA